MKDNYLQSSIEYLKGVGPNRAALLKSELNIHTIYDLLNFFPFRYVDKTKFYKICELKIRSNYWKIYGIKIWLHFKEQ